MTLWKTWIARPVHISAHTQLGYFTRGWIQDTGDVHPNFCTWVHLFHLHQISYIPTTSSITIPDNLSSPTKPTEVNWGLPQTATLCSPFHGPTGKHHSKLMYLLNRYYVRDESVILIESIFMVDHPCVLRWFQTFFRQSTCCQVSLMTSSTVGTFTETEILYGSQDITLCLRSPPPHTQTQPSTIGRIRNSKMIPRKVGLCYFTYIVKEHVLFF